MKTKQTAIDIFKEKLINIFEDYHDGIITLDEYIESINKATQQAKEMEKKQAQKYAEFCVMCDRENLPLLDFESYILTYRGNK